MAVLWYTHCIPLLMHEYACCEYVRFHIIKKKPEKCRERKPSQFIYASLGLAFVKKYWEFRCGKLPALLLPLLSLILNYYLSDHSSWQLLTVGVFFLHTVVFFSVTSYHIQCFCLNWNMIRWLNTIWIKQYKNSTDKLITHWIQHKIGLYKIITNLWNVSLIFCCNFKR